MSVRNTGFYQNKIWRRCSERIFLQRNGECEICHSFCRKNNYVIHHKIPLTPNNLYKYIDGEKVINKELAYGDDNLQLLCKGCHGTVHSHKIRDAEKARENKIKEYTEWKAEVY